MAIYAKKKKKDFSAKNNKKIELKQHYYPYVIIHERHTGLMQQIHLI